MANEQQDVKNLHVPQGNRSSVGGGMKSIMDAYNSQSKVQLYDDNTSSGKDEIEGRDIPLSALRPRQQIGTDEQGKPVYSKSKITEDMKARHDISKAYAMMNGMLANGELADDDEENDGNNSQPAMESVKEFHADYMEDVPDSNEGLLYYLRTCIDNAEKNLEMLKSLYAALQS